MRRYVLWLKAHPGKPVFVGYPAGFDFLFVYRLNCDALRVQIASIAGL
jgi:hypothetical protein